MQISLCDVIQLQKWRQDYWQGILYTSGAVYSVVEKSSCWHRLWSFQLSRSFTCTKNGIKHWKGREKEKGIIGVLWITFRHWLRMVMQIRYECYVTGEMFDKYAKLLWFCFSDVRNVSTFHCTCIHMAFFYVHLFSCLNVKLCNCPLHVCLDNDVMCCHEAHTVSNWQHLLNCPQATWWMDRWRKWLQTVSPNQVFV